MQAFNWHLLQVEDPYKQPKGSWKFCNFNSALSTYQGDEGIFLYVQSFLGILHLKQVTGKTSPTGLRFKVQAELSEDRDTALKVSGFLSSVFSVRTVYIVFLLDNPNDKAP